MYYPSTHQEIGELLSSLLSADKLLQDPSKE